MGERASLGSFYEEGGEARFVPFKKPIKDSPYQQKTEVCHVINVWFVVSFATSPGLKDSDHGSFGYDQICVGWERRLRGR